MEEMEVENQSHCQNPFNFLAILKNLGDHLKQSSLSLDDLKKLRSANTNFNQITRSVFLDKSNKSIVINSHDKMKEFLDRCEQVAPDIVKSLAFGPEFLPDSYIRPKSRSKFCPGISAFIRDLTLCKYELPLDQLLETLAKDFPNLSILQIRFHNLNVPTASTEIRIPSVTSFKLEMNLQRAACTPANLIPFLQSIFKKMPNIQHLDILEVHGRSFIETIVWDLIIEQDFKTLGLGNLVSLHRQTPMSIPLGRRDTYRKYLGLKNYLYDLKLSISYRETEVSVEFINDFLSQLDTKITTFRLLDGVEEMIPLGFGTEIKHLVLQSFTGSIRFIENLHQLESVKFVGIDMNSQLFNGNEEEEEEIVKAVLGADGHPNLRSLKAYGCEGGDKVLRILAANGTRADNDNGIEIQNHPWLL